MAIHSDQPPDPNSRSQKKLDDKELKRLAATIIALPQGKFDKLDLPESLRDAMTVVRGLTDHKARRRQLAHVETEILHVDIEPIRKSLEDLDRLPNPPKASEQVAIPSADVELASTLLDGGDAAVFALSSRFSPADLQTLRQAVRKARKDLASGKARDAGVAGVVQCLMRLG